MPRPTRTTRARQAAKPTTTAPNEPETEPRGRSRRTRSIANRISTGNVEDIEKANKSRDAALDKLANEDVTTTGDDSNGSIEVGRRAGTPQRRDTTGLDLDLGDDMFGNLDDSFELPQVDSSTLFGNSSHMKPRSRSRQSSIMGRNDLSTRPGSRSGATPLMSSSFNIGAFRRRAREPSILGTGRKSRADTTGLTATTTQDQESSESELEDFMPEAESTPVNNRRRTRASMNQEGEPEAELPELTGSRKRKSSAAPETSDRAEKTARSDEFEAEAASEAEAQPEIEREATSESESDLSELPSPTMPARMMERPVTPDREASYMAPPASSDSEASRDYWPDIHGLARKRKMITHENADNLSTISSPPSLTHSPNFGQSKRPKSRGRSRTRKSPPPLTTADLANLLPKRRQKKVRDDNEEASDEEMDTSGLGHDQDELSFLDARSTRRGTRSRAASTRSASRNAKQKSTSQTRSKNRRRTYGRNNDKENGEDQEEVAEADTSAFEPQAADETIDEGTVEVREYPELKKIAKKFEEVDRWEMSFEEASEPEDEIGAR